MSHARGRVLDIGCGAGRHALYLQKRGFEVVAIDISPLAVDVCRRRGVNDVRLMSITEADSNLGPFDTILMMGANFGLFANGRSACCAAFTDSRRRTPGSSLRRATLTTQTTRFTSSTTSGIKKEDA